MFNRYKVLLSILCIFIGVLVGCSQTQEQQIREDYLAFMHEQGDKKMTIDDVVILDNYGTYNGAAVVRINRPAFEVLTKIIVGGIEFTFSNSNTALVWKNGEFFELSDAYDHEILTLDNLISIAQKVNT